MHTHTHIYVYVHTYIYLQSRGQVAAASATCCAELDDLQRRPTGGHDRKGSADRESIAPPC